MQSRFCCAGGELLVVSSVAGISNPSKVTNSGIAEGALARVSNISFLESKGLVLRPVPRLSDCLESIDAIDSPAKQPNGHENFDHVHSLRCHATPIRWFTMSLWMLTRVFWAEKPPRFDTLSQSIVELET